MLLPKRHWHYLIAKPVEDTKESKQEQKTSKSKHAYYTSSDDTICVHPIHTLRLWRRVSAIFQTSILEGRCPSALQNKFRHCRDRGIVEDQSHWQLNTRQRLRELLENGKAGDVRGCVGHRQKLEIPKSPESANSSRKS